MGYNQDKKIVFDESEKIGLRYISLLHCISQFTWLTKCGFNNELKHLYQTCGLKRGTENSSETLLKCIRELDRQRGIFLERLFTFSEKRKAEKLNGRRSPAKKALAELYNRRGLLLESAIK